MTTETMDFVVGDAIPDPEPVNGVPAPERPGTSPEAPYGRKPDGTPYQRRPYKRRGTGKASTRRKTAAPPVDIHAGMREMYESMGVLALLRGDQELALMLIGEPRLREMMAAEQTPTGMADAAGAAWAKLAQQNTTAEAVLTRMLQTGVWAEVVNAHIPLMMVALKRKPVRVAVLRKIFARRRKPKAAGNGQRPA